MSIHKDDAYYTDETEVKLSKKICVTGMHRSGTSLVAMWLNGCGIQFAKDQLIGGGRFNRKGHFEDKRVVRLHHSVIESNLPGSRGWVVTKNVDFPFVKEQKNIARAINISYENTDGVWGWKDPRMSLVLKFWKELNPDLKIIMVWRSADSVVRSLMKRSHVISSKGVKLNLFEAIQCWIVYNRKLLEFCDLFPNDTLLVPLNYLIKKDKTVFNMICSKFDVNLKYRPITEFYEAHLLTSKESHFLDLYPGIKKITKHLEQKSKFNRLY